MLDEPTAGRLPIARRKLWDVLRLIRTSGRTLVLTSHSMEEECESLCTRIAIIFHGYVLCLGSSQHLKSEYGKGHTVILHSTKGADGRTVPMSEAEKYVQDTLGDSKSKNLSRDRHVSFPRPVWNWGDVQYISRFVDGRVAAGWIGGVQYTSGFVDGRVAAGWTLSPPPIYFCPDP
ncbi:ATP-binding cassette sub- A member 3 [Bulinus truncatus]|nr:ATP-binding cassette sub- A member 3 [Bulinus truncatus]